MNLQFIIDTIHELRAGIDMIAMPYEQETYFAEPDADEDVSEGEIDTEAGGCEIPRN